MPDFESTADYDPLQEVKIVPGTMLFARYRIVKMLGRGGMGEVWLAEELDGSRKVQDVVLKRVPPELQSNSNQLEKIQNSFNLVRKLRHPNICSALTFVSDDLHGAFCVLDFVPGMNLAELQRQTPNQTFSLEQTLEILEPIASALDYAHRKRTLHRDVKPQNIMVPLKDDVPVWEDVQLIDFDLAVSYHTSFSFDEKETVGVSGTLPYMSPEQVEGEPQDGRTDQYSLAVLAYQMLSGKLPFSSEKSASLLINQILNKDVPPIPSMPEEVNAVLEKALSKHRIDRYRSCSEMIRALAGKFVESENVLDSLDDFDALNGTRIGKRRETPQGFDPYYEWLGISPFYPLNHYTMLGLHDFETNRDVISNAADRQLTFVSIHQNGKYAAEAQKLMLEITQARICLLNPKTKHEYDLSLKQEGKSVVLKEVPLAAETPPVPDSGDRSTSVPHPTAIPASPPSAPANPLPSRVSAGSKSAEGKMNQQVQGVKNAAVSGSTQAPVPWLSKSSIFFPNQQKSNQNASQSGIYQKPLPPASVLDSAASKSGIYRNPAASNSVLDSAASQSGIIRNPLPPNSVLDSAASQSGIIRNPLPPDSVLDSAASQSGIIRNPLPPEFVLDSAASQSGIYRNARTQNPNFDSGASKSGIFRGPIFEMDSPAEVPSPALQMALPPNLAVSSNSSNSHEKAHRKASSTPAHSNHPVPQPPEIPHPDAPAPQAKYRTTSTGQAPVSENSTFPQASTNSENPFAFIPASSTNKKVRKNPARIPHQSGTKPANSRNSSVFSRIQSQFARSLSYVRTLPKRWLLGMCLCGLLILVILILLVIQRLF